MILRGILLGLFALVVSCFGASQAIYDQDLNQWTLTNGSIRAVFQLTPDGYFLTREFSDLLSGDRWTASNRNTSPIRLQTDNDVFDAQTPFQFVSQNSEAIASPAGVRQSIALQDLNNRARITVVFEVYNDQPILRYSLKYRNLTAAATHITWINMVPWTFDDLGKRYMAFRVNQWNVLSKAGDFQTSQTLLDTVGTAVEVYSGAAGQQCSWVALRDSDQRGLFAGWEFDGRTKTTVRQLASKGYVQFNSTVLDLNHLVDSNAEFEVPHTFLGVFHGEWDEAGYRTQRFVESILAKPAPDKVFPYVSWDSWSYHQDIDENMLRRNADRAAAIGVQLFVVDLGWARSIGDWVADPAKFPSGLGALSDYVHALGMKFGLHFALGEADPNSPALQNNPDWTATDDSNYFGAKGLCLAHKPAQDWIVQQAIRIIDDYHVDWIVQDGQNMVKQCTKTTHTHDPADSNYANSVLGINAVVSAIQAARPNVVWENCENGGQMMTFNMVRNYVTSATNDASGSLPSRLAVYGATYPFPPRYAERYMPPEDGLTHYATHSYRFGGPWVLMIGLNELSADQLGFLADEIRNYKNQRSDISAGKVYHLGVPGANATDAIQSYNPATDTAIAVITRAASSGPTYLFKPQGLNPNHRYIVWSEVDPAVYSQSGGQLMSNGVRIPLPTPYSSDVVHIEPQQ
ncbi:MAG TPA: glycoside hydrolase family 36 protein [Candidatus Solibacter sp.]|nr:glycoside hydrolase family 36 protein [Candidatus Solibacter sp.]